MSYRTTEVIGHLRASEDDPLVLDGIAVPYGQRTVSPVPEYGRPEAFAPGAFRADVDYWMGRADGAKLAFRAEHKARPIGTVQVLRDTPDGVAIHVQLRDTPAARDYADEVRSGLNGLSIEFSPVGEPSRRDGYVLHREAKLRGIAGSVTPAYDGARLSLRDMEDDVPDTETKPAEQDRDTIPAERTAEQKSAERDDVATTRSSIRITRQELPYGRDRTMSGEDERGRRYSILSDGYKAWAHRDPDASERLWKLEQYREETERILERDAGTQSFIRDLEGVHERVAGNVSVADLVGSYPNNYIPGLYVPRLAKGRPMGDFFQHFPISNAQPIIFPKAGTATTVAAEANEQTNPAASTFTTTSGTVTPALIGGETVVSRQSLDGSSPSAEAMVMDDLAEAYRLTSETAVMTAVEAGAGANGTAIAAATPYAGTKGNVVGYTIARFTPCQAVFCPPALYGVLAVQPDTGSLKSLLQFVNPTAADGTIQPGGGEGNLLGARVIHSYTSTVNVVVTAIPTDNVVFESPIARFSYDAVTGPAGVRVGLWAYMAAVARRGSLKTTAA